MLVDGQPAQTIAQVHPGQLVQLLVRTSSETSPAAALAKLATQPAVQVVYQDDHIACVVKPQGMATQGRGATLQASIKHCLEPTQVQFALRFPHQVRGSAVLYGIT